MDPLSASASVGISEGILGWYDKIKNNFTHFKPETKTMTLNYSKKTSIIGLHVSIPDGFRKEHNKIKIPAFPGFRITSMQDTTFQEIKSLWRLDTDNWILDARELPSSESYFIEMEGNVDEKTMKNLVHIKPALNRDNDKENDKYWLDASLKNPALLEKAWNQLQIDEVGVGVFVDVNKLFGLRIPQEIKDKAESIQDFLKAGLSFDRNAIFKTAQEYKRQEKRSPFHPMDFVKAINALVARDTLAEYVKVDRPYSIGDIDQPTSFDGLVPKDVKVQALTTLTLKLPQAEGYLVFSRQKYLEKIESEFDKVLPQKKKK